MQLQSSIFVEARPPESPVMGQLESQNCENAEVGLGTKVLGLHIGRPSY